MKRWVAIAVAVGWMLAGCDDGSPIGGVGVPGVGAGNGTPLAGSNPCALFSAADLPEHLESGYDPSVIDSDDLHVCETPEYAVAFADGSGSTHEYRFTGSMVQAIPAIGGHRASRRADKMDRIGAECEISLEITAAEYASVTIFDDDQQTACEVADQAAAIMVKRLP